MKTLKVFCRKKDWNQWGSLLVAAVVVAAVVVVAAAVTAVTVVAVVVVVAVAAAVTVVVVVVVAVSWDWKIYGFVWQPTTDIIWTSGRQRERQQETFILVSEKKFKPKKLSTVGFREEQFASEVFCCSLGNTLDHLKSKNGCGCSTAAEHTPRSGRDGFDSRLFLSHNFHSFFQSPFLSSCAFF